MVERISRTKIDLGGERSKENEIEGAYGRKNW